MCKASVLLAVLLLWSQGQVVGDLVSLSLLVTLVHPGLHSDEGRKDTLMKGDLFDNAIQVWCFSWITVDGWDIENQFHLFGGIISKDASCSRWQSCSLIPVL